MFSDHHRFRPRLALSLCLLILGLLMLARSAGAVDIAAPGQSNDFQIIFNSAAGDEQKYLTFGWNGWSGHTIHWRYNDSNRPSAILASAGAAVDRIQAAMGKWSAVCNVQFVYDGSTASAASLATNTRDGVNVIAWGALPGNTTAVTYAGASGFTGTTFTIDEADMIVNYQYNPVIDSTLLHEVGHLLGLKHSNQEGEVMSGPNTPPEPSTAYTALTALQADDIAGCQSLYGASATLPAAPQASASVAMLAFADTTVGAVSGGLSVTLSNTGKATLAINYTIVSSKDFSLLSSTCNAGATVLPGASCVATARFVPTATGVRGGTMTIGHNATPAVTSIALTGNGIAAPESVPAMRQMVEYRYVPLDYYFITSRDSEKATLDTSSGFARTGASFLVYGQAQGSMHPITRFYFDRVALGNTRGSHFYTLSDSDLAALANQNPTQSMAPGFAQNEGVDSYAYLPLITGIGGSCGNGLLPVYRLFKGAAHFPDNPNHRFTTSASVYNSFVALGWDGEGVNFCVPPN